MPGGVVSGHVRVREDQLQTVEPGDRHRIKYVKVDADIRKAALDYESAERQRESERRRKRPQGSRERHRREQAVAKAQAALETAKREHDNIASAIEAERAAVEKRSQAEDARWEKLRHKLDLAIRRARE